MDKEKRNRVPGKLFTVFIVTVVCLSFFSKSFYNYRLPVVSAASPKQGGLDFSVEGTAELVYAECIPCYAQMNGRISDIFIEKGDRVKKGQRLMEMMPADSGQAEDIVAPEDGIITFIGIKKGMYVSFTQNTVLYEEARLSGGCKAILLVSDEEAEHVEEGSQAVVKLPGRDVSFQGEVAAVLPYASADFIGNQIDIQIHSKDASIAGKKAKVTIRSDGALYDTLIPVSALRKDAEGYYVLVLQMDDSVLGQGYQACRRSVDLLDSDESYCAVRGLLGDESVIVAATDKVLDGDNVYYEGEGTDAFNN